MFAVVLTAAALTTAAPVPVTGGTGSERAIVRNALAVLDRGAVTSARIDGHHYLVLGPSAQRDPSAASLRAQWEAQALVVTVGARFAAAGDRLAGYRIIGNCGHNASCGSGGSLTAAQAPSAGPPGAEHLRTVVLANASATGMAVRTARVLPIGGGVLSVVVRLREDQLLDARVATSLTALFGPATTTGGALHFLSIEAPGGTPIAYGGTYANGGSWNYGGETGTAPVPRTFPAALARARTDLTVEVTHWPPAGSARSASSAAPARLLRATAGGCSPTAGRCSCRRRATCASACRSPPGT